LGLAGLAAAEHLAGFPKAQAEHDAHRVVLITLGGIRREESFSEEGVVYIPNLFQRLLPQALFYPYVVNEGVTAHVNTISSILTGAWQRLDDWGQHRARQPTLFAYLQKQRHLSPAATWVVTSNKAVTRNIAPEANVILSKQLMIEAVERIIQGHASTRLLNRESLLEEMKTVMLAEYERIGWSVPSMNPNTKAALLGGVTNFMRGPEGATGGDELTFIVAREVLRRVVPTMMMINFSGMEVAHSGTYSLHLAGIRNVDSLCNRMWRFLQSNEDYRDRTTLVVMPEFGRDPDGSTTNGFFNHRTDTNTNRVTWMMMLGQAVREPAVVERVIRQIDLAPTLGALLGVECKRASGRLLPEISV